MNAIDLFCGCGGLSLGMKQAGINILAAIDSDPVALQIHRLNMPDVPAILADLHELDVNTLHGIISGQRVNLVVGGPPCQGFSIARQKNGSNHGARVIDDERRSLYRDYFRFVEALKPEVFIFENVTGIKSAVNGKYYDAILSEAHKLGYEVVSTEIAAADFGLPQKRKRQIILGSLEPDVAKALAYALKNYKSPHLTRLGEAILDLPEIGAGEGEDPTQYDMELRSEHYKKYGSWYLEEVIEVNATRMLTAHVARPHNSRDLADFEKLKEGENSGQAIQKGVEFLFPYRRDVFKDRYLRQDSAGFCSTIMAHLAKDGLMYIHPKQNRSLTPREAARVQGFPDWFVFPVPRTHQFKCIGNAVPPPIGKVIGSTLFSIGVE